jgi:hypothetical protein
MAGRALVQLHTRLAEVRALQTLNPVRAGSLPRSTSDALASSAVNRGSVVLLCGHLEGFVEDLLLESVDDLVNAGLAGARIPRGMKFRHAVGEIRALSEITDATRFIDGMNHLLESQSDLFLGRRLST